MNRYEYDAFGNTMTCEETVPNRFRFAGEQYDQITQQYYLRARFYNPVIGRFLQEDDYYGDGLNLYAYCRNNPVSYVDPSGHGTESAPDKKPDNNPKDLHDMVDDINNGSGASPGDMEAIKSLAEEFGLDPSEFDVKSSKEVNQQALKDLVAEVNKAGGADPSDQKILKEFAEEYGMDYDGLGVKEAGGSGTGGSGVKTDTTRVGRWMSQAEYDKMVETGKVQMSGDNKVHVANPADIDAFGKQAPKGSIYVEFDVSSNTISAGGTDGWGIINGPGSLIDRLNAKKGLPRITEMPDATNIEIKGSK